MLNKNILPLFSELRNSSVVRQRKCGNEFSDKCAHNTVNSRFKLMLRGSDDQKKEKTHTNVMSDEKM